MRYNQVDRIFEDMTTLEAKGLEMLCDRLMTTGIQKPNDNLYIQMWHGGADRTLLELCVDFLPRALMSLVEFYKRELGKEILSHNKWLTNTQS